MKGRAFLFLSIEKMVKRYYKHPLMKLTLPANTQKMEYMVVLALD